MMSGAQMWVLKNEVLEKSNTRFPAPPIKNDLSRRTLYLSQEPQFSGHESQSNLVRSLWQRQ